MNFIECVSYCGLTRFYFVNAPYIVIFIVQLSTQERWGKIQLLTPVQWLVLYSSRRALCTATLFNGKSVAERIVILEKKLGD